MRPPLAGRAATDRKLGAKRTANDNMLLSFCEFLKSCRCEPDGFKGSVELLAEPDVVLIDRGLDFGRPSKGTHNTGKQRFDDLVPQDEVSAHSPDAGRIGCVATRALDAVNQLLALQFC